MRVAQTAVLLLAVAQLAPAQIPDVTPAGDPSVRSDSLYRLAVNPADHPDENDVWLLDDGIVVIDTAGRMKRTYRHVTQVLNDRAVRLWSERTFPYRPDAQRLVLNWARTVNPDGSPAGDSVSMERVSSGPGPRDMSSIVVRHHGLRPGMIVDQSWTIEDREPPRHPDFYLSWRVTTDRLTRRSRYIVAVPQQMPINVVEHNLTFQRGETVVNGMRVYTWAATDVPRREPEPFMDLAADFGLQRIDIASTNKWHDVALRFGHVFDSATADGPNVRRLRDSITASAPTRSDSLRLLRSWVRGNLRPGAMFSPSSGYDLRLADAIAATRSGGRVDALVLFAALARAAGWRAHPVLAPAGPAFDERTPAIGQLALTHVAIEEDDRRLNFVAVDEMAATAFLALPQPAFIPKGGGRVASLIMPALPRARVAVLIEGTVKTDGSFDGRSIAEYLNAPPVAGYRQLLAERSQMPAERARMPSERFRMNDAQPFAVRIGSVFAADSVQARMNADSTELTVEARVRAEGFVDNAGGPGILPVLSTNDVTAVAIQPLLSVPAQPARGPRRSGIRFVLPADYRHEFRVTLPAGWQALLPAEIDASSRFGRVVARATQTDSVLHIVRELTAPPARHGPETGAEFEQWLAEVRRALYTRVIVQRPERAP